jgi:parvulin-like peptidyl-prolyl isomerase
MRVTAALLLLGVLAASACSSAGKQSASKIEVTGEHLKAMVLTKEDLGPDYADFQPDPRSGPRSSEQLVDEAINPDDEALDVAKYAILLGQVDTYFSQRALAEHLGAVYITDGIVLYADAKGAASDLRDGVNDKQKGFSGTTKFGSLQSFKTFDPKVGQLGSGQVVRLLSPGSNFGLKFDQEVTITLVQFQRDRLVGSIVITRFDNKDVKGEVIDLARKLDKRMQAVLRGEQPPGTAGETPQGSGQQPAP